MGGACGKAGFNLRDAVDLKYNALHACCLRTAHCLRHIARHRDVIVLYHCRIPQPHPVIGRPACAGGIFL